MKNEMPLTKVDDFYVVSGRSSENDGERFQAWEKSVQKTLIASKNCLPASKLSGSFICAHPPDYRGRPALHYSIEDWRLVFQELKAIGINCAIWQASAWAELQECYYPSKVLSEFKQWDVIEPMLQAAADESMKVYLGSLGVLSGELSLGVNEGDIGQAIRLAKSEIECSRELFDLYGGGFHGYYLSSETYYGKNRNPLAYEHYGEFYKRVTSEVKNIMPELKILASPSAFCQEGDEQEAFDCLMKCFGEAEIDIFAPMDCVGQMRHLNLIERDLSVWKCLAEETVADFWVNCESFSITSFAGDIFSIEAADPQRFAYQMYVADQLGAQQLITWEAMHFMNPNGDDKAKQLRKHVESLP